MTDINTYILCGGKSSRMGMDKALLSYKKTPFVTHIINAAAPVSASVTLVSSLPQHHQLSMPYIKDQDKDLGPVSAINTVLEHTKYAWNLILSCDIPLIQTNFLEFLLSKTQPHYNATVAIVKDQKMPLVALYHKNCGAIFNENLKQQQLKMRTVLDQLNVNWVSIPKEFHTQLTNINTPEQLESISE